MGECLGEVKGEEEEHQQALDGLIKVRAQRAQGGTQVWH